MSYYVLIDDEQVGPLEFGAVAEMVERGTVVAETLGWTGGMADWEPVSKIPALAALFDAPQAPVSPRRTASPGQEKPLDIELVFNTAIGAFQNRFGAAFLVSLLYNLVSSGILVLIFGMAVVAEPAAAAQVRAAFEAAGETVFEIGRITALEAGGPQVVIENLEQTWPR